MTKKKKVQIFKLEERVLFEGAAAADIVAAVDNAGAADNADQADSDSSEKEDQFVQNTVRNAGPAETPSADSNVRNSGEGLPQADSANADPAEALIEGDADFSQLTDPETSFSGEVADFLSADMSDASESGLSAGSLTEAEKSELIILDKDAAAELDPSELEGKNVLILDGESDAAEQVENWLNEHDDQNFDSVKLVSDSVDADDIGDIQGHLTENAQVENISLADFRAELSDADQDMVIFPDNDANISVDGAPLTETDTVPGELLEDAAEERNELVIINSTTADLDNVLDQLGDSRDILIIDANSQDSAMEQISAYLEAHSDKQYDAVHILTHGNDSGLILGSDYVTDVSAFEIFRGHIADNGDMMIYGCETAATEAGQSFLQGIADATGADVAASTNLTGSAALGGDWTLEYSTGTIETANISLDSSWNHTFQTYTVGEGKTYTKIGDLGALLDGSDVQIILSSNVTEAGNITINGKVFVYTDSKGEYTWNLGGRSLTVSDGASLTVVVSDVTLSNASSVEVAGSLTLQNNSDSTSVRNTDLNVNLLDNGKLTLEKYVSLSSATATGNSNTLVMNSSSVIEAFTLKGGTLEFTAGTINSLTNNSGASASGKGTAFGTVTNNGQFTLESGSANSIFSSDDLIIKGGTAENVTVSSGTLTISDGSINTVENSGTADFNAGTVANFRNTVSGTLDLSGSASITENLTNAGALTITGGTVEALSNTGANASISGGRVNAITNYGSNLTIDSGTIGNMTNTASGSIVVGGGTFESEIINRGDLNFSGDATAGKITNEKTLTIESGVTLTVNTPQGEVAIDNKAGGIVNLDGILVNGTTDLSGIGLRNTDGGTINGTGTIRGFLYGAEILFGTSLDNIDLTGNDRTTLMSLTVNGKDSVLSSGEFKTVDEALDYAISNTGSDYTINIKLDLADYADWNTFLTISGDRVLTNLVSINSNTVTTSGEYVQLKLVLDGSMTIAMVGNKGMVTFDNVSLRINENASLTVNADKTFKMTGTYSEIESVSGLGTSFVIARVKDSAAYLTNYGTLSVDGAFTANYNDLTTDVSAIVNYGVLRFNADCKFTMTADIKAGLSVRPTVTGIANMTGGSFTADNAALDLTVGSSTATTNGRAATAILFSNTGTASFTDSTAVVNTRLTTQTYGLFNNGNLTLTDSSVDASGSEAYGLFNGSNGEAKFIVTKLPTTVTATSGMTYTDYLDQLYHIKGTTYSVYNENIFSTENKVGSGSGYTVDKGLLTGTVNGMDFRDAPLFALIGDIHTQGRADSSGRTTTALSDITVDGDVSSYGNALVDLKNLRLDGDIVNQLSTILVSGDFMTSNFYFKTAGGDKYNFSSGVTIRIVNNFSSTTTGSNAGGSIYFGTDQAGANTRVNFSTTDNYAFYNLTGTMAIANFSNLSSEKNPVQIFNFGVFTLDATNADKGGSKYYTLYVKEAADSSNLMDYYGGHYATADGIRDRGILNMNINGHNSASPIQNGMTLTGLDIRNTQNLSAAVTNYAGKLTINGGRLSATYSALDNMEVILLYGNGGTLSEVYVATSVAELNEVEKIAGSAYSVRNSGKLTIRGTDDTATLFTNELDFSSNYVGDYTAVVNSSVSVYMQEFDSGTNDVLTIDWIYWRSAFTNNVVKVTNASSGAVLPSVKLYQMTADSITASTQIDLPLDYTYTVPNTSDVWRGYGNALVEAAAVLHNVSFSAKSSPDTQLVFQNWGSLTVTGIKDAGNQFRDFDFLINNSSSTLSGDSFWASSDRRIHSGSTPSMSYQHNTNADITVGFDVAASHIARNYGELTMRGEKVNPDSQLDYNGRFIADGSSLTVVTSSKLRLVNFSVIGTNTPYAIQVEAGGQLGIYNGTYDSANNEWIGGSNAYITAAGGTAILNQGYVEMINGAITGSVNGIESTDMAGKLAIVNSTIAGNSGWGIISNIADPGSEYWNFLVANSTIAYNGAGGIWLKAGKLSLINSIVLNSIDGKNDILVNGSGTVDDNGGNIYGEGKASDGQSKLMNTFGSANLIWNDTYHVISVLANADARTMSVAWSYNAPDSGFFVLGHIWYNSATVGQYQIHYDQLGNARETSGSVIGAYVADGSPTPPTISVIVNTFKEDNNPNNNVWSLREVIEYLQSDKNTSGAYEVAFDWDALLAEESDISKWVFLLDGAKGALTFDGNNAAGITSIVINGSYNGNTNVITVSGDNLSDSVFVVNGMNLTLSNLTVNGAGVAGGTEVNVNGAAVRLEDNTNASLTVSGNVSFIDGNTHANGGAIYVGAGALLTMTGTGNVISGNTASAGGGIFNFGTAAISGTEIRNNKAQDMGGGIFSDGILSITGNIENNEARYGGGIYNAFGGDLTVNGNISGNTASAGGGLFNIGKAVLNGNLSGNIAGEGGAIYMTGGDLTVNGNITGNTANTGSAIYLLNGNAAIGSLDSHVAIMGNSGSLVYLTDQAGDLQIINAEIHDNGSASDNGLALFEVKSGTLSLLNSTVTGNAGENLSVLKMSGNATVNFGDATIAFNGNSRNASMALEGGTLNVVNSIIDHTGDLTAVTVNQVASLLNEDVNQIFAMDENGEPRSGKNGTLKISFSGLAGKGGVMTGFARTANGTQLFYQTEANGAWYDVTGAESQETITVIDRGQNDLARNYNGYGQLSIGAFTLGSMNGQSLVVTISGDKMDEYDGETSLREALEYADYLYSTTGEVQTITFKPGLEYVEADQTFTISSSVRISGTVTVKPGSAFVGDSVFTVKDGATVTVNGMTVSGDGRARGFEVINANLNLNGTVVRDGFAGQGGGILAANSNISVNGGSFINNRADDGAAIYSLGGLVGLSNFGFSGNEAAAGSIIKTVGTGVYLNDGSFIGNKAGKNLVDADGKIAALTVTTADNTTGSSLFKGTAADIVNSSITGTTGDGSALVSVSGLAQVANSVIVGDGMADSVSANEVYAAYSIFGNQPDNLSVNDNNVFGQTRGSVFNGLVNGKLTTAKDSPAATGVWTTYDAATGEINYTTRPDSVWTEGYNPNRMTWNYLGPGSRPGRYIASNLVGSAEAPSIGAFWGSSVKPDFGPGVNVGMVDPSYSGLFSTDWSSYVLANGILIDPGFYLTFATDSELGWYDDLYQQLFGRRFTDMDSFSVITGRGDVGQMPSGENDIDLSVKGMVEDDFSEFIEAPYHAEDGVPLTEEELNQIRNAAVTGERPEDSLNLSETVHQKVASALRSADLFKDNFDKALDTLLGLDA